MYNYRLYRVLLQIFAIYFLFSAVLIKIIIPNQGVSSVDYDFNFEGTFWYEIYEYFETYLFESKKIKVQSDGNKGRNQFLSVVSISCVEIK